MRRLACALSVCALACGAMRNEAPAPLSPLPTNKSFDSFWSSALHTTLDVLSAREQTTAVLRGAERRIAFGAIEQREIDGAVAHRMQFLLLPAEVLDAARVGGWLCTLRIDAKIRCAPLRSDDGVPVEIGTSADAARLLTLDDEHVCAIDTKGAPTCWAKEFSKWAESPSTSEDARKLGPIAEPVPDAPCFITRDKKLACSRKVDTYLDPPRVVATDVVQASVGSGVGDFAGGCAAKTDGSVVCWGGMNETGTSGDGKRGPHDEPWTVKGVHDAIAVARSTDHACALTRDHQVLCWGAADGFAYGDAALAIAQKYRLCDDGEAPGAGNCVGRAAFGEPHNHLHLEPVRVPELVGVTSIAAGYERTCGVRTDGRVLCVGGGHPGPWTIDVGQ